MALNSDRDGFLIPDERVQGGDLAQGIRGIKRNTDAILSLMRGRTRSLDRARIVNPNSTRPRPTGPGSPPAPQDRARASQPAGGGRATPAAPRERDEGGRFVRRQPGADVAGAVRQMTRQQAQQNAERERSEEAQRTREGNDQTRDARGRFGSGGGAGGGSDGASDGDKKGIVGRLKDIFQKGNPGALGDVDKVDPAIESAHEVMGMVGGAVSALKTTGELGRAVIGRGFGGQKDRTSPWFKRLLQQLKLMRRDDTEFHRAELRALNESGGGGDGGSFIGDMLKLLFGPVGAALVGAAALAWATMGDKISSAWNSFIAGVKSAWDTAVKTFMGIWEPIAKFFADKFGIVTNAVGKAAEATNTAIKNVTGVDVKETAKKGAEVVSKGADVIAEKAKSGWNAAKDWVLGKTSKTFESGKGGAGTVSTGKGDKGGVSYGTYQMSSKEGVADSFIKGSKYAKQFEGLKSGSKEFSDKWKEVAKNDPAFETAQHDYIKATHYDPQMAKLKKDGIDLSGRGAAVQDSVWSTSVQFGGKTGLIQNALKGKDVAKMSDKDIVSAVQDYKIKNNDALFASSSAKTREGTLARASAEKERLIKLADAPTDPAAAKTAAPVPGTPAGKPAAPVVLGADKVARPAAAPPAAAAPGATPASPAPAAAEPGRAPGVVPVVVQAGSQPGAAPAAAAPSAGPLVLGTDSMAGRGMGLPQPVVMPGAGTPAALSGPPTIPAVSIAAQVSPPPAPRSDAPIPLSSKAPMEVTVRNSDKLAGQDVKDRRLAHIATGGMAG